LRLRSFNNPLRVGQRVMFPTRRKIMQVLQQFKPDVIHVHEPMRLGALARAYAKHANIPVTLTVHALPLFAATYVPRSLKPFIEKSLWVYAHITLKKYTNLIVPTQTIADIIEQETGLTSNVIGFGMDLQKFRTSLFSDAHTGSGRDPETATRNKLGLPATAPIIIYVGRLDKDKSVDKLIRGAAPAILKSEAHLLLVGDGREKNHLIHLCKELGIEKKVHFSGFIPPSDLSQIYRTANIFVTASEIETQGIVLLEAAASGLPIVAVDATCISETVHDRVNGFLVRPGDLQGFSEALTALLNDSNLASALGANGRMLSKEHEMQNTWDRHEILYLEMNKQTGKQQTIKARSRYVQWESVKTMIGLK
jgi:glycosyltransferase involved in cell wall biosynthesis